MTPDEIRLLHALQTYTVTPYVMEQKAWRKLVEKKDKDRERKKRQRENRKNAERRWKEVGSADPLKARLPHVITG